MRITPKQLKRNQQFMLSSRKESGGVSSCLWDSELRVKFFDVSFHNACKTLSLDSIFSLMYLNIAVLFQLPWRIIKWSSIPASAAAVAPAPLKQWELYVWGGIPALTQAFFSCVFTWHLFSLCCFPLELKKNAFLSLGRSFATAGVYCWYNANACNSFTQSKVWCYDQKKTSSFVLSVAEL